MGASDLHMSCGKRPKYRLDGDLQDSREIFTIDAAWMKREMDTLMSEEQRAEFTQHKELDFSHAVQGYGRFRVNFYIQSGTPAAVFR